MGVPLLTYSQSSKFNFLQITIILNLDHLFLSSLGVFLHRAMEDTSKLDFVRNVWISLKVFTKITKLFRMWRSVNNKIRLKLLLVRLYKLTLSMCYHFDRLKEIPNKLKEDEIHLVLAAAFYRKNDFYWRREYLSLKGASRTNYFI